MSCKTKDCNGTVVNEAIGYCQYCANELWSKIAKKGVVSQKPKVVSQSVEKVSLPVNGGVTEQKSVTSEVSQSKKVSQESNDDVTLCSKCHKKPRSKSSKSYCKECHAARVKKWRLKNASA